MAGVYGRRPNYNRNSQGSSGRNNAGSGSFPPSSRCHSQSSSVIVAPSQILPRLTEPYDPSANQWDETIVVQDQCGSNGEEKVDEDLEYVKEFRELEYQKIQEVNQKCQSGKGSYDGPVDSKGQEWAERIRSRYRMDSRFIDSQNLTINTCKDEILSAVRNHQVTIVEGFTGCGKTTQVPQFLLDCAVEEKRPCKIVVTQPRRIAAVSVATRVCEERGWNLGTLVGYQVGMDRKFSEDSCLVYMTTGVLLQMMINRKNLNEWTHVIIDEVHERDLDTDLLLLVIKRIMIELGDTRTKVILMSATLNAQKFMQYFPAWCCDGLEPGAALVRIPHQTMYPVTEYYINDIPGIEMPKGEEINITIESEPRIEQSVYGMAAEIIASLDDFEKNERRNYGGSKADRNGFSHHANDRGAVLVFLPGLLEIETLYKLLTDATVEQIEKEGTDPKWFLLPLHSTITNEEQQKVFLPVTKGYRKIILATNIAESSITVTDIKYVIDFCLTKSLSCDPITNYTCLRLEWASKNQCVQRKGRCGRVSPGCVYRMVPKYFYDNLVQEAAPEMKKSSLESVVLHAKMLNMGSPIALLALAIDPPKISGIRRAVANLKEVGALTIDCSEDDQGQARRYNELDGDLTYLGKIMARLPIDMRFGRLIMMGHIFNLLDECIIIAAGLSTKSPFSYPYHRRLHAYLSKLYWSQNTFSDCFALVRVYRTWVKKFQGQEFRRTEERCWAKQYLVQLNVMREIKNLVDEIKRRLQAAKIDADENADRELTDERALLLKIVIAGAFYPNYFVSSRPRSEAKEYEKTVYKDLGGRNPATTVYFGSYPGHQPVELYEKHVLKYFDGSTFDGEMLIPYVEHQDKSNKLLVTFDSRGQKVGSLSHGLYRALKMRMLRQTVSFHVLDDPESYKAQCLKDLRLSGESCRAPPQISLPAITERYTPVVLTFAISPAEFYVVRESDLPLLKKVEDALIGHAADMKPVRFDRVKRGGLVFVMEGTAYYRARVEQVVEDRQRKDALVYFIDRGGIAFKKSHQLLWVRSANVKELYETPGLAIQCRIKEVAAPAKFANLWPSSSNILLDQLVQKKHVVTFDIFSIVESIMAGDIIFPPNNQSFRKYLLDQKLAEEAMESRDSQENFGNRISSYVARQDQGVLDRLNENQLTKNFPKPLIPPPDCTDNPKARLINLRGPNSPLELSFSALSRTLCLKRVIVDGASVNSVALDQDYLKPAARLLVAASVGISQRNEQAVARDTTMLPPLPGLAGLMTLLFSPVARLQINDSLTEYSGVLAGLGVDPNTGEPAYADHDMAVPFDAKIDNQDIFLINSIRRTMNLILRSSSSADLRNLRDKAIGDTISLISKPREQIEEWGIPLEWIDYPEGVIVMRSPERVDPGDVFQLHDYIKLD